MTKNKALMISGLLIFLVTLIFSQTGFAGYGGSGRKSSSGNPAAYRGNRTLSTKQTVAAIKRAIKCLENGYRCPEVVVQLEKAGAPASVVKRVREDLEQGIKNPRLARELEATAATAG